MDMSDATRPADRMTSFDAVQDVDLSRWQQLIGAVGGEIAMPLTAALERIQVLTATGRIDRASLRALREEVEAARQAGMAAQHLARFASGHMRQSHERLPLADTVQTMLGYRARETQARGVTLKPALKPVDVIVDASLLFSLLNTLLDWALVNARSPVEFSIDMKNWPRCRLLCAFATLPADHLHADLALPAAGLDSLAWRLVEQIVWSMGLTLARQYEARRVVVAIEFPRTANDELEGASSLELDHGLAIAGHSKPLAGSHVLVVASRREMRVRVRDAIRHMGLIVDLVASIDEAADFCRDGLPHAIVVEGTLRGERLKQLRAEIRAEAPDFVFIEIAEDGASFEMSDTGNDRMARVGRDAVERALPSVLMFELSKAL